MLGVGCCWYGIDETYEILVQCMCNLAEGQDGTISVPSLDTGDELSVDAAAFAELKLCKAFTLA